MPPAKATGSKSTIGFEHLVYLSGRPAYYETNLGSGRYSRRPYVAPSSTVNVKKEVIKAALDPKRTSQKAAAGVLSKIFG